MQDLRAAPRWSKTAVIVVLVVFGLVLLVAVFGLWAFTSQRERDEAKARENAFADGRALLEKEVPREIGETLEFLLQRVVRNIDPALERKPNDEASQTLRQFLERSPRHGALTRGAWRVGPEGDVHWLGGHFLVWDSAARIEERARLESRDREAQKDVMAVARAAYQRGGPLEALGPWATLAAAHGLAAFEEPGEPDRAQPDGMGYAEKLITLAAEAAGSDEPLPPAIARDAALRALEVVSLNRIRRDRLTSSFDFYADSIDAQLERLLGHLPPAVSEPLAWEIGQFRASRAFFASRDPDNYTSVKAARHRARKDYPTHALVVVSEGGQIFGIAKPLEDVTFVVLLDRVAIEKLVASSLGSIEPELRRLGLETRWMPNTQTPRIEGFTGRSHAVQLIGRIGLPYQLAIFQTGEPRGTGDGFTNLLFWVVIGLALAGLVTGGYVLVRLLTREIRLAQLKADFVSNLSHELKTPITSMLLFTEMLEEGKLTAPDEQEEAYGILGQESRRLQRIVNRMIDVARGEARQSPYNLRPGDLNRPVLDAATRFRRIVTEPGLDLHIDLRPDRLPVQMDVQAMDDVVTNLLSNAWKYRRGDRARIVVRTALQGRHAEIVVADDGIGIPRADRRKVFEMFYRSEQYLTHPVAGTGLGLALVRSVVAGHKGRIEVRGGEGGVGSVFHVRIPLDRQPRAAVDEADGAPRAAVEGESPTGSSGHGKVEAADDEPAPSGAVERGSTT